MTTFSAITAVSCVRLWPSSPTEFFTKVVDAQVTFARTASGVTELVLHHNREDRIARKVK